MSDNAILRETWIIQKIEAEIEMKQKQTQNKQQIKL